MLASTDQRAITPKEVTKLPIFRRNGKPLHIATVYRWMERGLKGVKLEHWQAGATKVTTEEAVLKFIEQLTHGSTVSRTAAQRRKEIAHADRELSEDGID